MKIADIIREMTLKQYELIGDFSGEKKKPGQPFNPVDRALVQHPVLIGKAEQFFANNPFNFRIFMYNKPGLARRRESGARSSDEIRQFFGKDADKILQGHEDSITVIFIGNFGVDRVMMTPWIMAHRIGHAIAATSRRTQEQQLPLDQAFDAAFEYANLALQKYYQVREIRPTRWSKYIPLYRDEYNALFNSIGTQRSSRENQIKRPHEFIYEMFVQYIKDGKITLNPLPESMAYGRKAWGRPTKYKRTSVDEFARQLSTEKFAKHMEQIFQQVLQDCVGKIYMM